MSDWEERKRQMLKEVAAAIGMLAEGFDLVYDVEDDIEDDDIRGPVVVKLEKAEKAIRTAARVLSKVRHAVAECSGGLPFTLASLMEDDSNTED